MTILVLDDNCEELDAFCQLLETLYPQCNIVITNNLLDFHEFLFESVMEAPPYDKIIIDAQLDISNDLDEDKYKAFLKEVGINDNDIESNDLMGWKYFNQVIRKKMPYQIHKVLIKTGFAKTIQRSSKPDQLEGITILNKGDSDFIKILKSFLNN